LGLFVRDVDTGGVPVEKIEIHLVDRGGVFARIQVAQGIDMGRPVIAHQQALGPVGEAPLKVFLCFPVLMVVPEDGFEVPGIDIHPLVDLLREVNQSRHKFHLSL
jgi:hypothetical protein